MKYSIHHTEARYAVDGKDHFKVMIHKKPEGVLKGIVSECLEMATGADHSTYEEAEKELSDLKNLIGRKVFITDKDSMYYDEWGIIKYFDGEYYHIAIANDTSSLPIFSRNEFRVPRKAGD